MESREGESGAMTTGTLNINRTPSDRINIVDIGTGLVFDVLCFDFRLSLLTKDDVLIVLPDLGKFKPDPFTIYWMNRISDNEISVFIESNTFIKMTTSGMDFIILIINKDEYEKELKGED